MARVFVTIIIFFMVFNALGGVLINQGVADDLNLDTRVSEDCPIPKDDILDSDQSERQKYADCQALYAQQKQVETGTGLGDTLFGMYNTVSQGLGDVYQFTFGGLVLIERAGVPTFITQGILLPVFSVMVFFEIASFMRGVRL